MSRRIVSFPHMGNYAHVLAPLAELIDADVMLAPPITRRTLEIGAKHSPEFVCIPFKYNLGNFIEALDAGADVLIQAGGGCRFGYYGEVQETILRDLGYDCGFIQLSTGIKPREVLRFLRRYNPRITRSVAEHAIKLTWEKLRVLDAVEDIVRKQIGFEVETGTHDRLFAEFLRRLSTAPEIADVDALAEEYRAAFAAVAIDKPERPMRVGIVGELYVLMEPFSNMSVERYLASRGVEVHRFCTVTSILDHSLEGRPNLERMLATTGPYVTQHIGAEGTESVYHTLRLMEEGFDGMVHLKPFGCMPEVNAMGALQRISRENLYPILFMSYDAQTSETGVLTRLEAFCDMLSMRRKEPAHA